VAAESLPSAAADLLKLLKEDPIKFNRMISHNDYEHAKYMDVALLQYIPVDDFANAVLSLEPESLRWIFAAFHARYELIGINRVLETELPWLKALYALLDRRSGELAPASRFRIKNYCNRHILPHVQIAERVLTEAPEASEADRPGSNSEAPGK